MVTLPRLFPLSAAWALAALVFAAATAPAAAQQGPMPVTVAKPLVKKITEWDEYTGRFEATNRVEIRARVSGFMESIHFKDGDLVNKGDLLFVIDPRPFEAQLDVAKASLEAAKTRVNLAEREFKRAESLLKRNNISRETFDQRQAELETAMTTVLSAQAQIRIAKLNLEFTQVKAPISGRASDSRIDVGNLVEGGSA
ncbi:MAG: efflux RND transporter periplasmic adaptor subunit, partial [Rhodospirillales bacterium]